MAGGESGGLLVETWEGIRMADKWTQELERASTQLWKENMDITCVSIYLYFYPYLSIYPERKRMTQVVECLPSKLEAQNSNTCPTKIISKYTFVEKVAWLKCRTPA